MTNASGDSEMSFEGANRSGSGIIQDQDFSNEETDDESEDEILPLLPGTLPFTCLRTGSASLQHH